MPDGDDSGAVPVRVDPPPPPTVMRTFSFAFAAGAAIAGFMGFCLIAGILAAISLVLNVADFFANRGTVWVPKSSLDSEGRLKTGTGTPPTRPNPRA
jgi:hypothetical protein